MNEAKRNECMLDPFVVRLSDSVTIIRGDCRDVLPVECDAVVTDPPYNIGKAEWDKIDNYLDWCDEWIAKACYGCKISGAVWCFHSEPDVLVDLSRMIAKHGRPRRNWVTWDKDKWTYCRKYDAAGSRRFIESAEYIAYHARSPIAEWIKTERERRGMTRNVVEVALGYVSTKDATRGTALCYRWEEGSSIPNENDLARLSELFGSSYPPPPTFNNPGKVSSVWQYPPAPANGHATPKPVELMQRIVETTTNPGNTVLDCFAGSGTTGIACIRTGRRFIGIEKDARYFEIARARLENELRQGLLPLTHNAHLSGGAPSAPSDCS